jgi:hypothetical protein
VWPEIYFTFLTDVINPAINVVSSDIGFYDGVNKIKHFILIRMGCKKMHIHAAGSLIWLSDDQQEAAKTPCESLPPPLLLSYWSPGIHIWLPAGRNTQKHHRKQMEAFTFWMKNHQKQHFLDKNLKQDIIMTHFLLNRSRIKINVLLLAILSCFCSTFQESYTPPAIRITINVGPPMGL